MSYRLRGVVLPDDEERDLYVAGDRISFEPLGGAEPVVDGGWLLPGLVDVHTHPGAEHPGDPLDAALLREHGDQHRDAGVTLLRVPGSAARLPAWFGQDDRLPRVYGAVAGGDGPVLPRLGPAGGAGGVAAGGRRGGQSLGWLVQGHRRLVGRGGRRLALCALGAAGGAGRGGPAGARGRRAGGGPQPAPTRAARPRSRPEPTPWSSACTWPPNCWTPWHGRAPCWCRRWSPSRTSLRGRVIR